MQTTYAGAHSCDADSAERFSSAASVFSRHGFDVCVRERASSSAYCATRVLVKRTNTGWLAVRTSRDGARSCECAMSNCRRGDAELRPPPRTLRPSLAPPLPGRPTPRDSARMLVPGLPTASTLTTAQLS